MRGMVEGTAWIAGAALRSLASALGLAAVVLFGLYGVAWAVSAVTGGPPQPIENVFGAALVFGCLAALIMLAGEALAGFWNRRGGSE